MQLPKFSNSVLIVIKEKRKKALSTSKEPTNWEKEVRLPEVEFPVAKKKSQEKDDEQSKFHERAKGGKNRCHVRMGTWPTSSKREKC